MELLGYLLAVGIGVALGLLGGGGSILTIPVLVYFFKIEPVLAGGYSLFVVGVSSLIGVGPKFRQKFVDLRTAAVFGIPSLGTVLLTRVYLLPAIPQVLYSLNDTLITRSGMMMLLFAMLMIAASRAMIVFRREPHGDYTKGHSADLRLALQGAVIGIVTGLLGAGGGFLIIPALVLLSKLPMKSAVGTSLLIIAANSIIGFLGHWSASSDEVNWSLLLAITSLAILGMLIGHLLGTRVGGSKLRQGFGWFILVMGMGILLTEILQVLN